MKNISKAFSLVLAAVVLLAGLSGVASALTRTRTSVFGPDGRAVNDPVYMGSQYKHIAGTTEILVCTGKCALIEVILSTGVATSGVRIRDTSTADEPTGPNTNMLPFLGFNASSPTTPMEGTIISSYGIAVSIPVRVAGSETVTVMFVDLD